MVPKLTGFDLLRSLDKSDAHVQPLELLLRDWLEASGSMDEHFKSFARVLEARIGRLAMEKKRISATAYYHLRDHMIAHDKYFTDEPCYEALVRFRRWIEGYNMRSLLRTPRDSDLYPFNSTLAESVSEWMLEDSKWTGPSLRKTLETPDSTWATGTL
jgi:hypothetical protein